MVVREPEPKAELSFDDMLTTGTTDIPGVDFTLATPSLNRASWETSQRTGARLDHGHRRASQPCRAACNIL
jgi:hypothetical protein